MLLLRLGNSLTRVAPFWANRFALAVSEGDDPFEPWVYFLSLGQDYLSGLAHAFVYHVGRPLKDTHPRVHMCVPTSFPTRFS